MRVSEVVAGLQRELRAARVEIVVLAAQLRAAGLTPRPPAPWAAALKPAEVALMTGLIEAGGQAVDRYDLLLLIPARRRRPARRWDERDLKNVDVHVCAIRKALGPAAIETVKGIGFRAGPAYRRCA